MIYKISDCATIGIFGSYDLCRDVLRNYCFCDSLELEEFEKKVEEIDAGAKDCKFVFGNNITVEIKRGGCINEDRNRYIKM